MMPVQQVPTPPAPPPVPSPEAPPAGQQTVITTGPDGRVTINTSEAPTSGVLAPQAEIPMPPPWVTMPKESAIVAVFVVAAVAAILLPLMRAFARRIEGRSAMGASRPELEELRDRVATLEQQQLRVHELEERVDFAERLLSAKKDAPQVRS